VELISRRLLKADAIAASPCDYFERLKMRLDEIAAVRFTGAHGQIITEEEVHSSAGRWR
jgi:hypothetical protein